MSEYQYYEFVAVDRPLDAGDLRKLRALSTRARITPTSFVNTYQWGDFRGDPRALMAAYFDAFVYLANWGTRRLMIRLPASLLDLQTARRFCAGPSSRAWGSADRVIVELNSEDAEGDWDEDAEASLASIVPVRSELAAGDRRLLYLAWLLSAQAGELVDDDLEPAVPPGLAQLGASLHRLVGFLRLDEDLLAVAAEASEPLGAQEPSAAELTGWVTGLPEQEKDALLVRLVSGDGPHLRSELARRFRGERQPGPSASGARAVAELREAAVGRREHREQLAARRQAQETARRERAQALARERHLAALAGRQEGAWRQVCIAIEARQPSQYDAAVELLKDLRAVSQQEGRPEAFARHLQDLRRQHSRKYGLLRRLDRAGLGASMDNPPRQEP